MEPTTIRVSRSGQLGRRCLRIQMAHTKSCYYRCWAKVSAYLKTNNEILTELVVCSGMISYRELTRTGLDVRMFERDDVPGNLESIFLDNIYANQLPRWKLALH
jgi:hypothetical protein